MSEKKFKTFVERVNLYREGDNPIFGESVISVTIDDESGGPFFCLKQSQDNYNGELRLDFSEVEPLFELLKKMMKECDYGKSS